MLYELRMYTCEPGTMGTVLDMWEKDGQRILTKYMKMTGQWTAESGTVNTIYTIWEFENYEKRLEERAALLQDEEFIPYIKECRKYYMKQEVVFMHSTPMSPIQGGK